MSEGKHHQAGRYRKLLDCFVEERVQIFIDVFTGDDGGGRSSRIVSLNPVVKLNLSVRVEYSSVAKMVKSVTAEQLRAAAFGAMTNSSHFINAIRRQGDKVIVVVTCQHRSSPLIIHYG